MKVAIVGSRNFRELDKVRAYVRSLPPGTTIVTGGARGVDNVAETTAKIFGYPVEVFLPDWNKHGKSAGFVRNNLIVCAADRVVAFWDGESKGTKHSIKLAEQFKKPLEIIRQAVLEW